MTMSHHHHETKKQEQTTKPETDKTAPVPLSEDEAGKVTGGVRPRPVNRRPGSNIPQPGG